MIKKFIMLFIVTVTYNHIVEAIIYYFKDKIIASDRLHFCCFMITVVTLAWNYFTEKVIERFDKKE